jgi:hypothetical protein
MMDFFEANRLFGYNPITGDLIHLVGNRKSPRHSVVGTRGERGVVICSVNGRMYKAHRIIWLLNHGRWPDGDVDHINGDPSDNRIENLRVATDSQNLANMRKPITNKSGKKGVSWHAIGKKWQTHIKVRGKNLYLGLFDTVEEAHAAYVAKAIEMHGEFARFE